MKRCSLLNLIWSSRVCIYLQFYQFNFLCLAILFSPLPGAVKGSINASGVLMCVSVCVYLREMSILLVFKQSFIKSRHWLWFTKFSSWFFCVTDLCSSHGPLPFATLRNVFSLVSLPILQSVPRKLLDLLEFPSTLRSLMSVKFSKTSFFIMHRTMLHSLYDSKYKRPSCFRLPENFVVVRLLSSWYY